jgi:hypothetical protein
MGKLVAISEQREPFVHLDADVFLWQPLPERVVKAPVCAQNPEPFAGGGDFYRPDAFELAAAQPGTWLPEEWSWHLRVDEERRGECCGIVGGTAVEFLRHYAEQGLRLVREPANRAAFEVLDRAPLVITVEQYLLAACIEHHRGCADSPFADVDIAYLFDSWRDAADDDLAAELGFTHLIADTKRDPANVRRLHRRVQRDHPKLYERCVAIARDPVALKNT